MFYVYVSEGFLTTCSFDFLSDDQDTKVFVACIFGWAYCIPMTLIVYFYSQLFKSVRRHEKMLRDQVSHDLQFFFLLQISRNIEEISLLMGFFVKGEENERQISLFESRQGKGRRDENREGCIHHLLPFCLLVDTLRDCCHDGSLWQSVFFHHFVLSPPRNIEKSQHSLFIILSSESLTPFSTMLPAVFAKTVSCIDPWIYAINHPRYLFLLPFILLRENIDTSYWFFHISTSFLFIYQDIDKSCRSVVNGWEFTNRKQSFTILLRRLPKKLPPRSHNSQKNRHHKPNSSGNVSYFHFSDRSSPNLLTKRAKSQFYFLKFSS